MLIFGKNLTVLRKTLGGVVFPAIFEIRKTNHLETYL